MSWQKKHGNQENSTKQEHIRNKTHGIRGSLNKSMDKDTNHFTIHEDSNKNQAWMDKKKD